MSDLAITAAHRPRILLAPHRQVAYRRQFASDAIGDRRNIGTNSPVRAALTPGDRPDPHHHSRTGAAATRHRHSAALPRPAPPPALVTVATPPPIPRPPGSSALERLRRYHTMITTIYSCRICGRKPRTSALTNPSPMRTPTYAELGLEGPVDDARESARKPTFGNTVSRCRGCACRGGTMVACQRPSGQRPAGARRRAGPGAARLRGAGAAAGHRR
jgi:hypothetical protein